MTFPIEQRSPNAWQHQVVEFPGEPDPVGERVDEIRDLVMMMRDAADTITQISNGEAKGEGDAMDNLRGHGAELSADLQLSADRYDAGGKAYDNWKQRALISLKTRTNAAYASVEAALAAYDAIRPLANHPDPKIAALFAPQASFLLAHFRNVRDVVYEGCYQDFMNGVNFDVPPQLFAAAEIGKDGRGVQANPFIERLTRGVDKASMVTGLASLMFWPLAGISTATSLGAAGGYLYLNLFTDRSEWSEFWWAAFGAIPFAKTGKSAAAAKTGYALQKAKNADALRNILRAQGLPHATQQLTSMEQYTVRQLLKANPDVKSPALQAFRHGAGQAAQEIRWAQTKSIGAAQTVRLTQNHLPEIAEQAARNGNPAMGDAIINAGERLAKINPNYGLGDTWQSAGAKVWQRLTEAGARDVDDAIKGAFKTSAKEAGVGVTDLHQAYMQAMRDAGVGNGFLQRELQSWLGGWSSPDALKKTWDQGFENWYNRITNGADFYNMIVDDTLSRIFGTDSVTQDLASNALQAIGVPESVAENITFDPGNVSASGVAKGLMNLGGAVRDQVTAMMTDSTRADVHAMRTEVLADILKDSGANGLPSFDTGALGPAVSQAVQNAQAQASQILRP